MLEGTAIHRDGSTFSFRLASACVQMWVIAELFLDELLSGLIEIT
jgi:hypothetical protein